MLLMTLMQEERRQALWLLLWPQLGPNDRRPGCPSGLAPVQGPAGQEGLERGEPLLCQCFGGPPIGRRGADLPAGGEPTESSACWVPRVQVGEGQLSAPSPRWSPDQGAGGNDNLPQELGTVTRHLTPGTQRGSESWSGSHQGIQAGGV